LTATVLPFDFGAPGHAERRAAALAEHLAWLPDDDAILDLFDYWVEPSRGLCAYLWASDVDVVARARTVLEVIGAPTAKSILRFLATAYWQRYLGWPDLLVWTEEDWFLAEVKSSRDRLSDVQKRWFLLNAQELHLPAKLVKIHRSRAVANG
jgi:hypothetical protein